MRKDIIIFRQREKRLLLLLFAFVFLFSSVSGMYAAADGDSGTLTPKLDAYYFYKWDRVYSKDALFKDGASYTDMALFWSSGGKWYGTLGNCKVDEDYIYGKEITGDAVMQVGRSDTFYTLNSRDAWYVMSLYNNDRSIRTDGDNGGEYVCFIARPDGQGIAGVWGYFGDDFRTTDSWNDPEAQPTVITGGTHGSYKVDKGMVSIIHNYAARDDTVWGIAGDKISADSSDNRQKVDQFYMYTCTKTKFSAFTQNYTIASGTTFSIPEGAMLAEGVTLTVEPGAVLTVDGTFFNNGTIENFGTVILNGPYGSTQGARMTQFIAEGVGANSGVINCYGGGKKIYSSTAGGNLSGEGNLIVMNGAVLELARGYGSLNIEYGASVANFGKMILPGGLNNSHSQFINHAGGYVRTGVSTAGTTSAAASYARSYINCLKKAVIRNEGQWENYSIISDSNTCIVTGIN